jgi:L-lactate dehydrogenase
MMDLNHGLPFVRPMRIITGNYSDLADADVVVICAGISQRPGQTRLELLQINAAIIKEIVPKITTVNQDAILIIASNPVDILTTSRRK